MTGSTTKQMLDLFTQMSDPTMYLSGFFTSPPKNFYTQEAVEVDIKRGGQPIAVVVQDYTTAGRMNSFDLYTNKSFIAPVYDEGGKITVFDLQKRMPGTLDFDAINFQAVANVKALEIAAETQNMIRRAVELQASQILQTGILDLKDNTGATLYTLDFKPKTLHFPNAGVVWSNTSSANPIDDLSKLSKQIKKDSYANVDQLILGTTAYRNFIDNDLVQKAFDNRRIDQGTIVPVTASSAGGDYHGTIEIDNKLVDVWTYGGTYQDPQSGLATDYMDATKAILRSSAGRMDATYGAIPNFGNPAAGVLPFLPPRLTSVNANMDIYLTAWMSPDRKAITVSAAARPLLIPTAIDTYGCLTTE